jgi:hypothetical protein
MHEDLDVSCRVLKRVSTPNHPFRSWSQVAKRERLSDDKITRAMSRSAELAGGELTRICDNRIVPTDLGHAFRDAAEKLLALAGSQTESLEVIRVGIAPGIDPMTLTPAVARFTAEWGGVVTLQLCQISEGMPEAVNAGSLAFAVAFEDECAADGDGRIEPALPLSVLIPDCHRLAGATAIDAAHFSPSTDLVFLAPGVAAWASNLFARLPPARRVEVGCLATLGQLVADGRGLGAMFAHSTRSPAESFNRVPALGVEPRRLGLVLPRRQSAITEPTKALIVAIREAARDVALPPLPHLDDPFGIEPVPELPRLPE